MNRRIFLLASGAAAVIPSRGATSTTVLYGDRSVALEKIQPDPKDLWVRKSDLSRINDFEVKPQGACREDLCVPIPKDFSKGEFFNLSAFARKVGEVSVNEGGVWSFGEIPVLRGSFTASRIAPDFAVPDRKGKIVHLNEFRGKKVLVVTWASW
ncbi:MAG: hypothetical protein LAO79_17815 [Acidobacteriia bacterium]|nr:hypothetical protein [Terriglobia bacterium]